MCSDDLVLPGIYFLSDNKTNTNYVNNDLHNNRKFAILHSTECLWQNYHSQIHLSFSYCQLKIYCA